MYVTPNTSKKTRARTIAHEIVHAVFFKKGIRQTDGDPKFERKRIKTENEANNNFDEQNK